MFEDHGALQIDEYETDSDDDETLNEEYPELDARAIKFDFVKILAML